MRHPCWIVAAAFLAALAPAVSAAQQGAGTDSTTPSPAVAATPAQPVQPVQPAPRVIALRRASSVANVFAITAVVQGGTYLTLADGTRWHVRLDDRPSAVSWRRGDPVAVREIPAGSGRFRFRLTNARDGRSVLAAFGARGRVGR